MSSNNSNTLPRRHTPTPRKSRSRTTSESDTNTSGNQRQLRRHPSQVLMWYTTVPQSLVNKELGTRHQPTRRSLKHSKMLVMSRTGKAPKKNLPPVIDRHKLGISLAAMQFVMALIMIASAIWVVVMWPHLVFEFQHYSGVPMLIAGWASLVLMTCCRNSDPDDTSTTNSQPQWVFRVKNSHIVINLAAVLIASVYSALAFVLHSFRLYLLYISIPFCEEQGLDLTTSPDYLVQVLQFVRKKDFKHCLCDSQENVADGTYTIDDFDFPGIPCYEVKQILPLFLTLASAFNFMSSFVCVWYFGLVVQNNRRTIWKSSRIEEESQAMIK